MHQTSSQIANSNNPAKYAVIFRELHEQILSGKYNAGERIPSEAMLVQTYNASRPTVARALHELELIGLIERKAGSGSFVRQKGQSNDSLQTTPQLGLLMPGLEDTEIFTMISGQLASLARNRNYPLIWGGQHGNLRKRNAEPEATIQLCRQLIERKVNGVFFAPFEWSEGKEEANQLVINELTRSGITVVLLDRDVCKFPYHSNLDLVGMDNFSAGYIMAEHLIKLGCRKICFFSQPYSAPTVSARIAGVREALLNHGIYPEARWTIEGNPENPAAINDLMAGSLWDACICANDRTAAQLIQGLIRQGVRVPHDIRLAGFDNVKYATLIGVPLTTIHQPCDEIATLAFEAMLRRMANPLAPPCSFMAHPQLVIRESCGAYLEREK